MKEDKCYHKNWNCGSQIFEEDYIINTNKLAVSNKYSDTEDLHESDTSNKVAYLK